MKIITRTAAAALLISLPMALGACGSDGGSKPSKADVKAGFEKAMKSSEAGAALPQATLDKYSNCVVDKTYDKLSNKALNVIKKGDTKTKTDVPKKDKTAFDGAVTSCQSAVTGG